MCVGIYIYKWRVYLQNQITPGVFLIFKNPVFYYVFIVLVVKNRGICFCKWTLHIYICCVVLSFSLLTIYSKNTHTHTKQPKLNTKMETKKYKISKYD